MMTLICTVQMMILIYRQVILIHNMMLLIYTNDDLELYSKHDDPDL
jgi:hypothetical protein